MGILLSLERSLRRFDESILSMEPRLPVPPSLAPLLKAQPLVVADVGASGGVEPRWGSLRGAIRFLTFEPRAEAMPEQSDVVNFPVCLAAEEGRRVLRISRHAQSSSMLPYDTERLRAFAVGHCFDVLSTSELDVDTLDRCLSKGPSQSPDFLKLDVEGAELEVLRGGHEALDRSILGVSVEVNFLRRHIGGANFSEVDGYLTQHGFELFHLRREQMIRGNLLHGTLSQPQLVWGDALYFLNRATFLRRIERLPPDHRALLLSKFVLMLLAYRIHDYPLEIVSHVKPDTLTPRETVPALTACIREASTVTTGEVARLFTGAGLSVLVWLFSLPVKAARQQAVPYLKRRFGRLLYYLWRATARGGECNASISDPPL